MRREERLPGRLRAALRSRRNAVVLEDRFDRIAREIVAEALQSAANARVTPGRVLVRHADHERGDVWLGTWATRASLARAVVFCGDEPSVPPQNGVGCHDASDVPEAAPAEHLALHGEATSLVVGETQPSGSVRRAENPVLLEQVVNDRLVLPIDPAGDQQEKESEWARQRVHGESLPEAPWAFKSWRLIFCRSGADLPAILHRRSFRTGRGPALRWAPGQRCVNAVSSCLYMSDAACLCALHING